MRNLSRMLMATIAVVALLTACKDDKENQIPREARLKEKVQVLTPQLNAFLEEPRQNSLKFSNQDPFFETVKAGDILVYEGDPDTGEGAFLREVTSVEFEKDGSYIYYTRPASVIDLFDDIQIDHSASLFSHEIPIDVVLHDKDGDEENTTNDQVHLTGNIEMDIDLDRFYLNIYDGEVESTLKAKGTVVTTLDCEIGLLSETLDIKAIQWEPINFPTILIPTGLVFLPYIPLTPTLTLSFGADGTAQASVSFGTTAIGTHTTTINYATDQGWGYSTEESLSFDNRTVFEASAALEVFAQAGVGLDIFRENVFSDDPLLEGQFFAKTYLRAEANINENPPCQILAGVRLGVKVDALFVDEGYEDDMLVDFSFPIHICTDEPIEAGEFVVYGDLRDGASGSFSDIVVSSDGNVVWASDGVFLYKWDSINDEFIRINFVDEYLIPNGKLGLLTISDLQINPLNGRLHLALSSSSGNDESLILEKQGSTYTEVLSVLPRLDFGECLWYDEEGNMWYRPYEGELFFKSVNGEIEPFTISYNGIARNVDNISFSDFGSMLIVDVQADSVRLFELEDIDTEATLLGRWDPSIVEMGGIASFAPDGTIWIVAHYAKGGVYHYKPTENDLTYFEIPGGTLFGSRQDLFVTTDHVWYVLKDTPNMIFQWDGSNIFTFDGTNSNLPQMIPGSFTHTTEDIAGLKNGPVWFTFGDYIVRYE